MGISISAQSAVFMFSCLAGVFLGAVYDMLVIFRIAFGSRPVFLFAQDFLYCIFSSFVIILFVYYANSGQVRGFSLFGCALCLLLYRLTLGRLVALAAGKIIGFIRRALAFVISITFRPLAALLGFLIKLIIRLITWIFRLIAARLAILRYRAARRRIRREALRGFGL